MRLATPSLLKSAAGALDNVPEARPVLLSKPRAHAVKDEGGGVVTAITSRPGPNTNVRPDITGRAERIQLPGTSGVKENAVPCPGATTGAPVVSPMSVKLTASMNQPVLLFVLLL